MGLDIGKLRQVGGVGIGQAKGTKFTPVRINPSDVHFTGFSFASIPNHHMTPDVTDYADAGKLLNAPVLRHIVTA